MSLREKPIYLSNEVWRALWILAKADTSKNESGIMVGGTCRNIITPDEVADDMLRQAIREQHPDLITHLADMDALEKQIIEKLRRK